MSEMNPDFALALKMRGRFFYGFGKGGRVMTAWCLAGAKLLRTDCTDGVGIIARLKKQNVKYEVVRIGIVPCSK